MKILIGKEHTVTRQLLDEVKHDIMNYQYMVNQKHFSCPLNWALCQLAALRYQNMTDFLLNNSPITYPSIKLNGSC